MSINNYLKETRAELKHVSWPTRSQTATYSALVIGISLFVGAYLGIFDSLFTNLLAKFLSL